MKLFFPLLLPAAFLVMSCNTESTIELSKEKVVVFKPESIDGLVQEPDGGIYKGEYKNGLFHGKGEMVWSNGDRYEGEFKNGLRHGKGTYVLANGTRYAGEHTDGFWHGEGVATFKSGDRYEGEFKMGDFGGKGRFVSYDGTAYEGDFELGRLNGTGSIFYKSRNSYSGEIKDWLPHGKGTFIDADSSTVYIGTFVSNEFSGEGEIIYKNGVHYKGQVKNWLASGQGRLTRTNGEEYTGEFKDHLYNGKGVLKYKNGNLYEGEFKDGLRHGYGKLIRAKPKGHKKELLGWWDYGVYQGKKKPKTDKDGNLIEERRARAQAVNAEKIFYQQSALLNTSLIKLRKGQADTPNMYFLGFAGDGSQDVFMKEINYARNLFDDKFRTRDRSYVLINNHKVVKDIPIASVTNLETAVQHLAKIMDREQDILFLYMSSHGSQKYGLHVALRGLPLNSLPAKELGRILRESKIKWKVIVISSCYSGGFIKELKDPHTLVMTSASDDRVSFGCSDDADFTYFGEALLTEAIPTARNFVDSFHIARELVKTKEKKQKYDHSMPQIWKAPKIEKHLSRWRQSLQLKAMQIH